MEFVGKAVKKEFKGFGLYTGIVQSYDASSGFLKIVYDDGDSEDLDFSEVASLLSIDHDKNDAFSLPNDHKPKLGRKPKKRRRFDPPKATPLADPGNNSNNNCSNSRVFVRNGSFDMNRNADLDDGFFGDLRENDSDFRNLVPLNVDLNETLDKELNIGDDDRALRDGFDLNAGFNLNLNEGFEDFNQEDEFRGSSVKRECIDLNVDANGDLEESPREVELGTRKRECVFDLNFRIDEDVNDDVDGDCEGQVKEVNRMVEEPGVIIDRTCNMGVDGLHVELGEGIKKVDVVYGGDCRVCDSAEALAVEVINEGSPGVIEGNQSDMRSENKKSTGARRGRRKKVDILNSVAQATLTMGANGVVEDCTVIINKNQGDVGSANNEVSGRRRRGRRRKADSLSLMQETAVLTDETVIADTNHVKEEDSAIVINNNHCEAENGYKVASGSRRKRRKSSADVNSMPETTVLRRSSRRGSAKNNILNTTSSVVNDRSLSPEVSVLTEEKLVKSCRDCTEEPVVLPPKVQLPPSSQNLDLVGIPILDVFSIYACLRSFSTLLFLSPFEVEEFVAALKCDSASSLIDCIHVSILQTLRKHLEYLSDEGSESASDCLRSLNWNFLDLITWPIFMVEYLLIHELGLKPGFDLGHLKLLKNDYYKQPVSVKVEILRCLCDGMIEVEAIRSELNRRSSGAEFDIDPDRNVNLGADKKRRGATDVTGGSCVTEEAAEDTNDWNSDECCLCKMDGSLICCDGCPAAYHSKCVGVANNSLPEGEWYCPECAIDRHKPWRKPRKSLRGAELLGVDPYGRLYFSSCGYLLVSDMDDTECSVNYYHRDDLYMVIEVLKSSGLYYSSILEAIYKQLDISVKLCGAISSLNSVNHAMDLDMCMAPAALASSEMSAIKNETVNEQKPEENIVTGCSGYLDAKSVNPLCVSSEGSAETTQTSSGNQSFQREGASCSISPTDISNKSEGLGKSQPMVDGSLTFTSPDIRCENNGEFVAAGPAPSAVNTVNRDALQVQPGASYINYYTFGYTASLIAENLLRKSSDKTVEETIKSDEEIISAQMKIILKKCDQFHWLNALSLNSDVQKEKCGWCFSCRVASDELGCLFNMGLGPVQESSVSELVGIQPKRNNRGHLMDIVRQILFIEDRLLGLLLGPWLNPHFSAFWRKSIHKASDIVSVKHLLLKLESNLCPLALSAEWFKHIDSAVTVGSASHIVTASSRASSKNIISRKRARNAECESKSASGLSFLWWRGGRLSRQIFSWKVLPGFLVSKAARQAGCSKVPGILYPENSDFAKRSKYVAWRAAVDSATTIEQLALQVRELDSNIKWDEIENRHALALLDKESRKSIRLFKKVIVRRKCMEGEGAKYLLDFGKRRVIPEVVLKNGSVLEDQSSEKKRYWLNESYLPLHLLKSFEEKRIARKSSTMGSGKLSEGSGATEKSSKKRGFSYLFAKAERSEFYQCGHCNKDVLIREAVCCQYCKGFFHKRHVRKSASSITAKCTYTCHRCQSGKYGKIGSKPGKTNTRREKNNIKSLKVQQTKSKKASISKSLRLRNSKKALRGRPLRSQNKKKVLVVVPLRRSARKAAKYNSLQNKKAGGLQNKKAGGQKKGKQVKSKTGTYKKPKKGTSWRKERTQTYHSYWLNGLLLSRKPDDERVMHFRRKRFLAPSESIILDQPKCSLCCEEGYTSTMNYISCELCGEWFHGDAFGLHAENISVLVGFRCHGCRNRIAPVCPHVTAMRSHGLKMSEEQNTASVDSFNEVIDAVSYPNEINLVQESFSSEDYQGTLNVDESVRREEQLVTALDLL